MSSSINVCSVLFFLGISIGFAFPSFAKPCCGKGSTALPSLLANDDRGQIQLGYAYAETALQPQGNHMIPLPEGQREWDRTWRLQSSWLLSDRLQGGVAGGWSQRSRKGASLSSSSLTQQGIQDTTLSFAYEAIPAWDYRPERPLVFLFGSWTFPTGTSRYELLKDYLRVTGQGFHIPSIGGVALYQIAAWDASLGQEVHVGLPRTFEKTGYDVFPGWGTSLSAGVGYSFGRLPIRVGGRGTGRYDTRPQGRVPTGRMPLLGKGAPFLLQWEFGVEASYALSNAFQVLLAYQDQTLIPGKGVNESRSFSLTFQQKWER